MCGHIEEQASDCASQPLQVGMSHMEHIQNMKAESSHVRVHHQMSDQLPEGPHYAR